MSKSSRAASMHLADSLGGMRRVNNITDLDLKDGGGAEAVFSVDGAFIGFATHPGGYTLSTTIQLEPSGNVKHWQLRKSRERVKVMVEFGSGDRVQFDGVLAKYDPKADNQGKTTASVEWALAEPEILAD